MRPSLAAGEAHAYNDSTELVSPSEASDRPWEKDERDVTLFGSFALDDSVDIVACSSCKKPVLREAFPYHTRT